ncbi:MAG: dihydropteroate synthase [Chloroflexota bacterium]|nr:dihydropteroate synthase [Chloroflexota bacterium]
MFAIANNITTRNRRIAEALRLRPAEEASPRAAASIEKQRAELVRSLAKQCVAAGADALDINLQWRYDKPEVMRWAVERAQEVVSVPLCLSAHRADTVEAGLRACRRPPIVNHVSLDKEKLEKILPLAARHDATVVLLLTDPAAPGSPEDILKTAAILVGAANESGIPNERIWLDPGALHITTEMGQRHARTILELVPSLRESFGPAVGITCWISNVSVGVPRRWRPNVENAFLAMLAGSGLSSAFVNVLGRDTVRTVRLIKVLRNEVIYSDREIEP